MAELSAAFSTPVSLLEGAGTMVDSAGSVAAGSTGTAIGTVCIASSSAGPGAPFAPAAEDLACSPSTGVFAAVIFALVVLAGAPLSAATAVVIRLAFFWNHCDAFTVALIPASGSMVWDSALAVAEDPPDPSDVPAGWTWGVPGGFPSRACAAEGESVGELALVSAEKVAVCGVSSSVLERGEGFACDEDCCRALAAGIACTPTPTPFNRMSRNEEPELFALPIVGIAVSVDAAFDTIRTPSILHAPCQLRALWPAGCDIYITQIP